MWGMVAAVGEAKVLEGGWVDPPPPLTRLGVGGGTCTSEAAR